MVNAASIAVSVPAGADKPNMSTGLIKPVTAVLKALASGTAGSAPFGGQGADMFGGLSMEAPSVGPSQAGMDGLLGLGPTAPAVSPSAPASADLFGGLSVGGKRSCLPLALDAS